MLKSYVFFLNMPAVGGLKKWVRDGYLCLRPHMNHKCPAYKQLFLVNTECRWIESLAQTAQSTGQICLHMGKIIEIERMEMLPVCFFLCFFYRTLHYIGCCETYWDALGFRMNDVLTHLSVVLYMMITVWAEFSPWSKCSCLNLALINTANRH